ncbi:MAG TPA: 4,5-DOPA dioxygenase extradiol [Rudaea sp.]|nr:4,5-DOPA dioxygenase extradiol [Rudaea sp.]
MIRLPALFVGHGSPMNAIEDNGFTHAWRGVADSFEKPQAIVCVSAHWTTRGTLVSGAAHPQTIHDFYGFPQPLFDVRYEPSGDPALAQRITQLVNSADVAIDPSHGLDHGAWSVLRIMYPNADVPTLQLSLDMTKAGEFHLKLGQELSALRDDGVLILGSGNIVHNLRLFDFRNPAPADFASRADALVRERIVAGDHASLAAYPTLGLDVARAVPTAEHFLPLLYVLGAKCDGDDVRIFNDTVQSTISMTSIKIG